jgi:hypothetical protein
VTERAAQRNRTPATDDGRKRSAGDAAHQLGNTLQGALGNTALAAVLQREPDPAAADPWDRRARDVFGSASYDDYLAKNLKSTTFFGQTISNIHDDYVTKLALVETNLTASQGANYKAPHADSTLRRRKGMHGWGMAVDFDVLTNPYVLNESGESALDAELIVAYDHIAQFILGKTQSDLRKLKSGRSAFGTGKIDDVYDALRAESDAAKRYFALKDNDAALAQFIKSEWPLTHTGQTPPDLAATKTQMQNDYEVLGGKTPAGTKRPTGGKGDRPFAPTSSGGAGDPATGFLTLGKEFVKAMTDAGFAWGAVDIAGEPGDMQHFDLRLSGLGAKAYHSLFT